MSARPGRLVLLGHPVGHSLSPRFQNAALERAGIPLTYEALDVAAPRSRTRSTLLAEDSAAGNITIPHKEAAAALCARLSPLAERVGAVNTFWLEDEARSSATTPTSAASRRRCAHAWIGARRAARIALLGAGGAAAAVLAAIERWPECEVHALQSQPARARAARLALSSRDAHGGNVGGGVQGATLVVNATALGLDDDPFPLPIESLPLDAAVLDLVYRRGETPWVRAARACGHRAADGLAMLVEQGALAFERWFGIAPDRAR